jgi:hypothetical protein
MKSKFPFPFDIKSLSQLTEFLSKIESFDIKGYRLLIYPSPGFLLHFFSFISIVTLFRVFENKAKESLLIGIQTNREDVISILMQEQGKEPNNLTLTLIYCLKFAAHHLRNFNTLPDT